MILITSIIVVNVPVSAAELLESNTYEKSLVSAIANGSDEVVGNGIKINNSSETSEISLLWKSDGLNHTHQYLVARSIIILENDFGIDYFYNSAASRIMEFADKPDEDEIGIGFNGHFWDPDTNKNYLGQTSPTAKTNFLQYYNAAVNSYSKNKDYSYQYLGRTLHYMADIAEPHHSSNMIAVLTNHSQFEEWVDKRRLNYSINSSDKYIYCIENDLTTILKSLGKSSKNMSDDVRNVSNWDSVAKSSLGNAQKYMAGILYRFLCDVGEIE